MPQILFSLLIGAQLFSYLEPIKNITHEAFSNFPYLINPDNNFNQHYWNNYKKETTMLSLAQHNNKIIGFVIGIPLYQSKDYYAYLSFENEHINPATSFYYGEVVVVPEYQKRGITTKLFKLMEDNIKKLGFETITLATVKRSKNHPLRPENYSSSTKVWKHLGFRKTTLTFISEWPTIQSDGSTINQKNELVYWVKNIEI